MNEYEIVKNLRKIKLPVQRSPEWFDMRKQRITASSAADLVPVSKEICEEYVKIFNVEVKKKKVNHKDFTYSNVRTCGYGTPNSFILNKVEPQPFKPNDTMQWGVAYEEPATRIWESKNEPIIEFGLLPHPTIDWLGASPDGITESGRMLEIKCPPIRTINGICPVYYYIQMQIQLEVTGLSKCDYEEVKFTEYADEEEFLEDTLCYMGNHLIPNQNIKNQTDQKEEKGLFIERIDNDDIRNYSLYKYIYPPKDPETNLQKIMTPEELNEWANNEIKKRMAVDTIKQWWKWLKDNKYKYNPWYLYRYTYNIRYWKSVKYSVATVDRSQKFFKLIKPYLEEGWKKVLYYRANPDKLDELRPKKREKKKTLTIKVNTTKSKEIVNRMTYSDSSDYESDEPEEYEERITVNRMVYD